MKRIYLYAIMCAALVACAAPTTEPATPPPATQTISPLVTPPVSPLYPVDEPALGATTAAVEYLSGRLGVLPEQVQIVSAEGVEWPDASFGCPQPDVMYAQVVTPGYLVTLQYGDYTYLVHTNEDGTYIITCDE